MVDRCSGFLLHGGVRPAAHGSEIAHVFAKDGSLDILSLGSSLCCLVAEVNTLGPLPRLDADEEDEGGNEDDTPLP